MVATRVEGERYLPDCREQAGIRVLFTCSLLRPRENHAESRHWKLVCDPERAESAAVRESGFPPESAGVREGVETSPALLAVACHAPQRSRSRRARRPVTRPRARRPGRSDRPGQAHPEDEVPLAPRARVHRADADRGGPELPSDEPEPRRLDDSARDLGRAG